MTSAKVRGGLILIIMSFAFVWDFFKQIIILVLFPIKPELPQGYKLGILGTPTIKEKVNFLMHKKVTIENTTFYSKTPFNWRVTDCIIEAA